MTTALLYAHTSTCIKNEGKIKIAREIFLNFAELQRIFFEPCIQKKIDYPHDSLSRLPNQCIPRAGKSKLRLATPV